MAQLVVRNLEDDVKERLQARAKSKGRSLEAEVRNILTEVTSVTLEPGQSHGGDGFGTIMNKRFAKSGLTEAEAKEFGEQIRGLRRQSKPREPDLR